MKACYRHLGSEQSENHPYYTQVDEFEVERSKNKIDTLLKEALENKTISSDEYIGMVAADKEPGRFYCNFKVHKQHSSNEIPPERPIIYGSGSITEGIATFVNYHIKEIATTHSTYLQDTPDFLRIIENKNSGPQLNQNVIIVTMDAKSLFTNITHTEGIECLREQLDKRPKPKVETGFLMKLMEVILYSNVF